MRIPISIVAMSAGVLVALPAAADVILVNDPFTDGNLTGGADAGGIAWYGEDGSASLGIETRIDGNSLKFTATGNNRSAHGRFAGVTLGGVGDFIELTFDVQFDAAFPDRRDGFQIGIGNDAGTPADGATGSAISDDTGFEATLNPVGGNNDGTVNEVGGQNNLGRYDLLAAGTTTHRLTLRLERIAGAVGDDMQIAFSGDLIDATGNAITRIDADPITFTFDQVVFGFSGRDVIGPVWIDNVNVTSNVPEPSSLALIGAAALCLLPRRR